MSSSSSISTLSSESSNPNARAKIRQQVRERRRNLTHDEQKQASIDLISQVKQLPELASCQHIALYLAQDGELDTKPLIDWLWQQGKHIYLPVIHPFSKGQLLFVRYQAETALVSNQYKILEPPLDVTKLCPQAQMDLIFSPLVAFDPTGQRLGMGGGYYDRYFEYFNGHKIGLAHDCQCVAALETCAWDQPLDKIITPSQHFLGATNESIAKGVEVH
ncbi:MAG: 5-formyltetrahydrofolate cyclo-ligase [Vibrio sp.]